MPRTAVVPTTFTANAATTRPAGTTIDATLVTNGVVIADAPFAELVVEIDKQATSDHDVTFAAGDDPPAIAAGQGALVVNFDEDDIKLVGPFTGARFAQDTGDLHIDFETGTTGTLRAYRIPRTA